MGISSLILTAIVGSYAGAPYTCAGAAQISVGDDFIPRNGKPETVRSVARVIYGADLVGFVYRTTDDRLFAQARSGMPARDQVLIGIKPLPPHRTGDIYRYSAIVPIAVNPWRDLVVAFCR